MYSYPKSYIPNPKSHPRGFSLLELLIVIAIMGVLGAAGAGFYRNFVKNVELESASKVLASDLRSVRSKSMIGDGGAKWGAHLVNTTTGNDYYVLFSTATTYSAATVASTTTLPLGIAFTNPAPDASMDIIFSKISGFASPETITLVSEGTTKTIQVTSIGTIN